MDVAGLDYPSEVYKITVTGKPVFLVQNYNSVDTWVTIFDGDGRRIASGGTDSDALFSWDKTAYEKWRDSVLDSYESKGISGVKDHTLVLKAEYGRLPKSVLNETAKYRKECLDMEIGTRIDMRVYKFTVDGKGGFIVQCIFDEYKFASVLDASGKLIATGYSDASEFGWNAGWDD